MRLSEQFQRLAIVSMTILLACGPMHARAATQDFGLGVDTRLDRYSRATEYFSEAVEGEILIPVHLLGAVSKEGVYHIPKQTDLVQLLALAGGTRPDSDLTNVTVKRRNTSKEEVHKLDFEKFVRTPQADSLLLQPNDIVLVGAKEPLVSQNTLTLVGLIGTIFGIVLSGAILANQLSQR